jgi:hypothetical protein
MSATGRRRRRVASMEHLDLGDVEVTYELRGDGEPIVFLHASAFVPL